MRLILETLRYLYYHTSPWRWPGILDSPCPSFCLPVRNHWCSLHSSYNSERILAIFVKMVISIRGVLCVMTFDIDLNIQVHLGNGLAIKNIKILYIMSEMLRIACSLGVFFSYVAHTRNTLPFAQWLVNLYFHTFKCALDSMFEQLLNWFYPLLYVHFPISHYIICIPIVFRHIQVVCINFIWKNGWPASTIITRLNAH